MSFEDGDFGRTQCWLNDSDSHFKFHCEDNGVLSLSFGRMNYQPQLVITGFLNHQHYIMSGGW